MLKQFTPHRHSRTHDESGSVIIAVVIIATLSFAVAALLSTVSSGLQASRTDQDRTDAFQQANGGIDHALYRFDTNNLPRNSSSTGNYKPCWAGTPSYCGAPVASNAEFIGFEEEVRIAGTTYRLEARADPPGQMSRFRVNSTSLEAPGRQRQAVATIEPNRLFKDGFFTLNGFDLRGSAFTPIAYDSKVNVNPAISEITGTPRPVSMGTNGTVTGSGSRVAAFAALWIKMNMYGRADQAAADVACEGCGGAPKVVPITDQQKIVTIRPPAGPTPPAAKSCPRGGVIRPLPSEGGKYVIPAGDYVCNDLVFGGTIVVGPDPADSARAGKVRFWATETLNFDRNAVLNDFAVTPALQGAGVPSNLQIFYDIPSNLADQNNSKMCGNGVKVFALLYTPGLIMNCPGAGQPSVYGAVVANIYLNIGGPQFQFFWDRQSTNTLHTSKYRVVNWRECPVGSTC